MKHSLLSVMVVCLAHLSYGQVQMNMPVNFQDPTVEYAVLGFEGAENSTIVTDPTDATNTVVQVIKSATAAAWAGTTLTNANEDGFMDGVAFSATVKTINIRVWTPQPGTQMLLKVEDSNDPTIFVETLKSTTVGGAWETITFNFANPAPNPSTINLANTYNKLSIFFNYGTTGADAGEQMYYFDDVVMGEAGQSAISNVTFQVDMNDVTDNFTTPEVNGTFNTWCGSCAPMTDENGDGVWELVIALEPGLYEYKFSYDAWAGQETLVPGSSCTMTTGPFTNRVLEVSGDQVLDVVCWASCAACGINAGPYPVTFKIDMSQYAGTFTTPEVNGNFNNWCGACAPMTDADGDNIWEVTIPLNTGSYEYKFSYDGWTGQEALTDGSACTTTIEGYTNRYVMVEAATELTAVCWESCEACSVSVAENTLESALVYPNPANNELTIQLPATMHQSTEVRLYAITGQLVYQANATSNGVQIIPTANLSEGMYEVQISNANHTFRSKVMIQH